MPNIKRGDFVKSVAKATNLSAERAKKVVVAAGKELKKKGIGFDLGYTNNTLSKNQEKEAINAISGVIKKMGYKYVVGLKDERGFRKKLTVNDAQFKQNPDKTMKNGQKPLKSAADFLDRVRQGVPGSKATEAKQNNVVISGNALGRQTQPKEAPKAPEMPKIHFQRVSLADNAANIETLGHSRQNSEPLAPDIG